MMTLGMVSAHALAVASMPSGASILLYAKDYDSTNKAVPNTVASGSPIATASRWNTEVPDSSEWSGYQTTLSTVSLTGPTGATISAQRIVAAGDWFYGCAVTIPSTNYVLCFDYITQAGSSQSFKGQNFNNTAQSQTLTATASWQRAAVPMTGGAYPIMISPDRATGVDVIVANVTIGLGTTDVGRETLEGHAYFDKLGVDKVTNPATGVLDLSAGGSALARLAASITPTSGFTCGAMLKRVSSSIGSNLAIFSKRESFTDFAPYIDYDGTGVIGTEFGGSRHSNPSLWDRNGSGWHVMTHRYDGTNYEVYLDDALVWQTAVSPSAVSVQNLLLGAVVNIGSFTSGHQANAWFMYPSALTKTQIQTAVYPSLVSRLQTDGQTYARCKMLWAEGDSITASNVSYVGQGAASITGNYLGGNSAVGGSVLADVITRWNNLVSMAVPAAWTTTKVYSLLLGANDLTFATGATNQDKADSFCAALFAHADTVRAAGWQVILATCLPIDGATTHNAVRALANPQILAAVGTHCDAVADYAADAQMGIDASYATYPANWTDGTHPNATGHARLAPIWAAAVNSVP